MPRLQKALAAAGVASRRASEAIITAGRVTVNGNVVTELGTRVDPDKDDIRVDTEPIRQTDAKKLVYVMLNKPVGVVSTTSDAHANETVVSLVSQLDQRVYPVGRLDADSSGLILLTNDGEFANRMTHPRYHVPKVYRVRVRGFLDRIAAQKLAAGLELDDGMTAPAELQFIEYEAATQSTVIDITLYEGRNRQVRRMMEAVEHPVRSLTRIGFGSLRLKGLLPGTWRKLRPDEVAELLDVAKPTATPVKTARKPDRPFRPRNAPAVVPEPEAPAIEAPRPTNARYDADRDAKNKGGRPRTRDSRPPAFKPPSERPIRQNNASGPGSKQTPSNSRRRQERRS